MSKKVCKTNLGDKWKLIDDQLDEDNAEQIFARYNKNNNTIEFVNLIGLKGWGLDEDDPDYDKFFVDSLFYACEELDLEDPEILNIVKGHNVEENISHLTSEQIALNLYWDGYGRDGYGLPKFDSYREAFDKFIGEENYTDL